MERGITQKLARELADLRVTERDRAMLRQLILDFFAASYAGYRLNRAFNNAVEAVVGTQYGSAAAGAAATVFYTGQKLPAEKAAFMNAVYAHGAELDDGNKKAMGHVGVHVIPAVFALAEAEKSSAEAVLEALAVGYEAYIRISSAAQPGLVQRGFHSTGMAGTPACAAACAKLLGLDAGGIEDAMALATTLSGGLLSYGDSRPAIKPLNPGHAAENGVFAACLAARGVRGPSEALEGPNGWFHAAAEKIEEKHLQGGDHLLLHDCYIKLYPSCRHTHCGIEAVIGIHERLAGRGVRSAEVFIYPNAIRLAGQILYPQDADETKFSIHYTLACSLLRGRYGIGDMDPPDLSEPVRDLIGRIRLSPDESMEDRAKGIRGARVRVTAEDGEVLEETVTVPRGDPEKPLSWADVAEKLAVCAGDAASPEQLAALERTIAQFGGDAPFVYPLQG